ncbi:MAG: dihydroneopterin aldolase [Actinomycetota bacterium]
MDRIRIEGIEFHGFHGVPAAEREIGHRYRVDAVLELDVREAAAADDVSLTVDYGAAARRLLEIGAGPSVRLVETLAERMCSQLLAEFPRIQAVEIKVAKIHLPLPLQVASAAVEIRRERRPV